jgi:hypothetical protein
MVIDTACSSSMVALDVAITDLRLGKYWKFTFKSKMFLNTQYMKNMNKNQLK